MIHGLVLEPTGAARWERFYDTPMYKSLGAVVGGYIEIVRVPILFFNFVIVVNDRGYIDQLPLNLPVSLLYKAPIHGTAIFVQEQANHDGADFVDCTLFDRVMLEKFLGLQLSY